LFSVMLEDLKEQVSTALAHVELGVDPAANPPVFDPSMLLESHSHSDPFHGELGLAQAEVAGAMPLPVTSLRAEAVDPARPETWSATPRNAPCPCGSGKKYKYCHGNLGLG
ncbi:MAG: SEC-C domain-containing protein, partial [Acidiphilium sp.]|nr:SEC-C domain-containing protein [Acidiphilium sp.]